MIKVYQMVAAYIPTIDLCHQMSQHLPTITRHLRAVHITGTPRKYISLDTKWRLRPPIHLQRVVPGIVFLVPHRVSCRCPNLRLLSRYLLIHLNHLDLPLLLLLLLDLWALGPSSSRILNLHIHPLFLTHQLRQIMALIYSIQPRLHSPLNHPS